MKYQAVTGSFGGYGFSGQMIYNPPIYNKPEPIFIDKLESKFIGDKQILLGYDDKGIINMRNEASEQELSDLNHQSFVTRKVGLLIESVYEKGFMYFSKDCLILINITTDINKTELEFRFGKYEVKCVKGFSNKMFKAINIKQSY